MPTTTIPSESALPSSHPDASPPSSLPDDPSPPGSKQPIPSHTAPQTSSEALSALSDPNFLPSLTTTSPFHPRALRSHLVLLTLLLGGIYLAYFVLDVAILQTWPQFIGISAVALLGILLTGGFNIDWYSLLLDFWWLSFPLAGAAGLALVVMQENATSFTETD